MDLFGFLALGAVFVFATAQPGRAANSARFAFMDVGQGDSALLSDGNGFNVLIDGGQPAAGPTVVAYLRSQGLHQVDVMVASHSDSEHIGGLTDVLQASDITVKAVVFNGHTATTTTWSNFGTEVANDGLVMTPAAFPGSFNWGALTALVLNPDPALSYSSTNNESVVLLVRDDNVRFLFTGDIDATAEAQVVARGTPVAAQILKVAHHGRAYSSGADFLSAVSPNDAVISVGPNSYGHPAGQTLDRLAAAGARIWHTDQHGTIVITSDGQTYTGPADVFLLYLPAVMKPEPTATPTLTATTPADTATPTATTAQMPGQNVQCQTSGAGQICASVSDSSPARYTTVTVYGRLIVSGAGQGGQAMTATWHYKTSTPSCGGTTDGGGLAQCSRSISGATAGYQANVDVSINGYAVATWFTPR